MKKLLSLIASFAIMLTLVGCGEKEKPVEPETPVTPQVEVDKTVAKVAGLKGPTSFSLAKVIADNDAATEKKYETSIIADVAEVNTKLESGELDIAAVPANVASVLYNKLNGAIKVLNVNTYGVLYILGHDESVKTIKDLEGKTLYTIGKGGTPDVSINYLLKENNVNANIEFKSEAPEALGAFMKDPSGLLMVPEPFVTVATTKNKDVKININLNDVWQETTGQNLVTGTFVVRTKFLEEHPTIVEQFMNDFEAAVNFTNNNVEEAAKAIASLDIVAEPIAKKSIPRANLVDITGDELESTLGSYLEILYGMNPKTVGGKLPGEDFYYKK